MKVHGGIKGIANNQSSLDQYFIIAPEVSNIIEEFRLFFGIVDSSEEEEHYQLKGGKNVRITDNVNKVLDIFEYYNTNFEESENVYNTITKKILPQKLAETFLEQENEGLMQFIDERIERDISIWEPLKKTKLPTFAANIKMTLNNNVIKIKEERKLMARLIVAARSRPEIDLSNYFGEFEFSVVPKSMFSADGNLLKTSDKSVIVQEIEKQFPDINITNFTEDSDSVLIFDGMVIANRISIQKCQLKNWIEFANKFIDIVLKESKLFSEVRVICMTV